MKCIGAFEMADYIEGHLSSEEKLRIVDHIKQCRSCMETLAGAIYLMSDEDTSENEALTEEETRVALEKSSVGHPKGIIKGGKKRIKSSVDGCPVLKRRHLFSAPQHGFASLTSFHSLLGHHVY
ncbi:MAG: zf-HC2 domain-containing protein [Desulfobacterales bacterium]|nr:zf-HC2 domain-containing protein [Desulfobacterales bacterium]